MRLRVTASVKGEDVGSLIVHDRDVPNAVSSLAFLSLSLSREPSGVLVDVPTITLTIVPIDDAT